MDTEFNLFFPLPGILLYDGLNDENYNKNLNYQRTSTFELGKTLIKDLYHEAYDHFSQSIDEDKAMPLISSFVQKKSRK